MRRRVFIILVATACGTPLAAQEAVTFGAWRAFCAPTAGCVLGVKTTDGDALAFVEPPSNDDRLLLILKTDPATGTDITLFFDKRRFATLGPADGWRRIDSDVGPAIQIAPSVVKEGLSDSMRRRDRLSITYLTENDARHRVDFSLNGYSDARGFADDG